jgi:plasmid stabilization system protein ParE
LNRPIFLPAAEADIQQAFDWYEAREPGLGVDFLERVEEAAAKISANPFQYQVVEADVRRAPVPKRPYALWYRIAPDGSVVIACLHTRRDPALARRRALRRLEPT